ncbi:MAG: Ig-like domain repeat protein, partial [Anaerolineae bacterium]
GSAALTTVPLDLDGVAQMSTDAFEVATHSLTAEFSGSVNQMPGTSPTWSHRVWKAATTTALTSVPASSPVYGESFQVSAKVSVVAPGAGSPTGNVRFTFVGPVTKSYDVLVSGDGTTAFTYTPVDQTDPNAPPALIPGTYSVTAAYLGDSHFNPSTSSPSSVTVVKSPVTITLSPSVNPSVFGQLVAFSVIVSPEAPGSGAPSGLVTFKADGLPMACSNGPNPATLDSQSRARCDFSALAVGSHTIAAEYAGDATFSPKTESLTQVVDKTPTATTLTSSVNPSVFGQSVTFDAHVAILSPGSGIPTGDVVFKDNGTPVLTATLDGAGNASYTTAALTVGPHTMTADYQGTADIETSTVDLAQQVNKAATTTALAPPDGTSFSVGSTATFVATITVDAPGGGTVGGTVAFQRAGLDIAGCGAVPVAAGTASCATSSLPVGTHPVRAVYSGSASHATSQSPTQFYEVLGAASATALTSSANPSVFGQPVTFDATVTGGVGTPTGEVIFKADGINIGTAPLVAGVASFTTASLAVGTHAMTALYTGDATYSQSLSPALSQVVSQATTATALTSSVNPSVFGQQVTFSASVTVVAPGAGTPTGTVTFKEGVTTLGVGFVGAGGTAEFSTASLAVGSHPVTATYDGDASFAASTSGPVSQVVDPASTTTTVTGTPNPSFIGDPVTFVATVVAVAPGGGVPTGSVAFTADASPIAGCSAVALDAFGQASCTTSSLTLGSHNIEAAYGGSTDHGASTSPVLVQVVSDTPVDLGVVSVGRPNPVKAGDMLTITVTATNHSLVTGVSATLSDALPPQVEFSSLTPAAGWTCTSPPVGSSGTVSCSGFLPAASDAVFTVVVDVPLPLPAGTLLTNTATITGAQPDLNPGNNTSVDETTVFRTRR